MKKKESSPEEALLAPGLSRISNYISNQHGFKASEAQNWDEKK